MSLAVSPKTAAPPINQKLQAIRAGDWRMLLRVQFAAFVAVGLYAAMTQRYLYGDGSYFLIMILQQRDVLQFDFARYFAHWLTQFPAASLIRVFGCRDIGIIGAAYGTTLILLPQVSLLLTLWAARSRVGDYLVYPLIASSILFLDVSFFSVSESLIGVALFFPMLYLLLFSNRLNMARSTVLIGLAVLSTRTYECYLLLSWPLIVAAFRRGHDAYRNEKRSEVAICFLSGLLFLCAFAVSAYSVVYPLNAQSRANFFLSALLHVVYPPVWFSLLTLAAVFSCLWIPERRKVWTILSKSLVIGGVLVMALPLCRFVAPPLQYVSRIQCLYVPFLMGIAVLLQTSIEKTNGSNVQSRPGELWRVARWTCLVAVVFQFGATWRWDEYRHVMLDDLQRHQAAIPFHQSAVYASAFELKTKDGMRPLLDEFWRDPSLFTKQLIIGQFNWGWAVPSLSVILSATHLGSIKSVICAPDVEGWQPFDPNHPETIPDLSDYGIKTELGTPSTP